MQENRLNTDGLMHFTLLNGQARALLVDSTQLCEEARRVHQLSRVATAALGRLLSCAALMGSTLKGARDSLTATLKGGGPLGTVMAVAHADGTVKGSVDRPEVELPLRPDGKLDVGGAVGRSGKLSVVKDLGLRDPYVGQVNLVSGEVAEDFALYFTASEQTPSLVSLGVLTNNRVVAAGGLIVQSLPGCSEEALTTLEKSAPRFTAISGALREGGLHGAARALLGELSPVELMERPVFYRCDCSRERIERVLISLGREELEDMIHVQRGAQVDCHFCNARYEFSEEQLRQLLDQATQK